MITIQKKNNKMYFFSQFDAIRNNNSVIIYSQNRMIEIDLRDVIKITCNNWIESLIFRNEELHDNIIIIPDTIQNGEL